MRIFACAAALWAVGFVANANAALIDFEGQPVGNIAGDTLVVAFSGYNVTFAGNGLRIRQFGAPFPNSRVLSTLSDTQVITVTIDNGYTFDSVSFENLINGTYTAEVDIVNGKAFNAANGLLDEQENSNTIHTLTGPGIAKVEYISNPISSGYVLDNFEFTASPGNVVPEPASIALWSVFGVGFVGTRLRRRFSA